MVLEFYFHQFITFFPMKRLIDIIFSITGIVTLSPLILITTLFIITSMGFPIFFLHERVGRYGKDFKLIKFRTMINLQKKENITSVTTKNDPRITRLGKLLRNSKIDEIPGLFNVLIGHMSIVGPRPEVKEYISKLNDQQKVILSVKPGLTSPASLKYINEETILSKQENPELYNKNNIFPDKINLNIDYVNNSNFLYDIIIMFQTVNKIIKNVLKK